MCFGNTTIIMHNTNLNSTCCGFPSFVTMPMSFSPGCFGYGFTSGSNMFEMGAGMGLGYAAGMAVFNGVKSAVNWIGKGIKNAWNWITGKNK